MISMKGKFQDWKEIKSDRTYLVPETARVCQMHWSDDGQIFSLASDNGGITCYLTKVCELRMSILCLLGVIQIHALHVDSTLDTHTYMLIHIHT